MKKIFTKAFLIFSCFLVVRQGVAQTNIYHPFPTGTAYWGIGTIYQSCSSSVCPYERILQMGDTIVNAMAYKKVYSQWGTFGPPWNCGGNGTGSSCYTPSSALALKCLLRQDSVAKKVYVAFPPAFDNDTLLYDFNLQVGDTLPNTYALQSNSNPNTGTPWIVLRIDSILISGHYNKAFIFDSNGQCSYLVEGVGSSSDLLYIDCCFEGCQWVDCFNSNPVQFGGSGYFCDNYSVAGIKKENSPGQLTISPNPSSGKILVELTEGASCLYLFNILGKEIKNQKINGEKIELDITDCDDGVYFVEVRTNAGTITRKIVKH